jgi:hypothetical protein
VCSVFPVFADSARVSNTSSQGRYSEGARVLLSAHLLSSLSYRNSHLFLSFSTRYGTLFGNQKPTRKQRLMNSSMSVHQFSETEVFMHQLTYIFCNIKVEVTALSSYEEKEELFKEQVH